MNLKLTIFSVTLLVIVLFSIQFMRGRRILASQEPKHFSALFLISQLLDGPELIDPKNTESIWAYYLLENLSCGLVRDSKESPTGYEGCIAERFYQADLYSWIFKIRKISWSDGTPVTKIEIDTWIESLKSLKSRHIQLFQKIDSFSFNETSRELKIHFSAPIGKKLLHELSLADAGLFPARYKTEGWRKTVGPFVVESWEKSKNKLLLSFNRFSPLYNDSMPKRLELKQLLDPNLRSELFKSIKIDLAPINAMTNPSVARQMIANAPNVYVSHPTLILYFSLNRENILAKNLLARNEFSQIITKFQEEYVPPADSSSTLLAETQMIPKGFDGRLNETDFKLSENKSILKGKVLKIRFYKGFQENNYIYQLLMTTFAKANVVIEPVFSDDLNRLPATEFGALLPFLGNQIDPSGSWSFLLFSQEGPIHPWLIELKDTFKNDITNTIATNENFFLDLHKEILTNHYVVPFLVGSQRYLLSERVDASGWNRFDSRLRFNELKMRK